MTEWIPIYPRCSQSNQRIMTTLDITLPHQFIPRPYQEDFFHSFIHWIQANIKRFVVIWHRRAGKDKTAWQCMIYWALQRKWVYYYIFPEYEQGRKIFWDGIDNDWMKMIDHIPKELIANTNDQQMKITLINGSIIQIIGTDRKINNIVGWNPVWCIFSEYSISNPLWWDLIRPILKLNDWWAIFVYTPRGKNHGYELARVAENNPDAWFYSLKWANQTTNREWEHIVSDKMIEEERRDWMDEDLIQQEYFCSFDASIKWAYYAESMRLAHDENRITAVPFEEALAVNVFFDLWFNDTTALWFTQQVGKEVRIIDHYEMSWESLWHYIQHLREKKYTYDTIYLPHDAEVHELQTGKSRKQFFQEAGFDVRIVPRANVLDGIESARRIFKYCWFDKIKCERWLSALSSYHKEYDEKNRTYRISPKHDWASNSADAFRYMAQVMEWLLESRDDYFVYVQTKY